MGSITLLGAGHAAAAAIAATTWDPAKTDLANITLSGGNLTATRSSGYTGFVNGTKGTTGHTTGKYFYSVVNGTGTANWYGFANATEPVDGSGNPSTSVNAVIVNLAGFVYANGSCGSCDPYTAGDTVYMAWDLTAKRAWIKVNSGNWNATGGVVPGDANGIDLTLGGGMSGGPYYPLATFLNSTDTCTANFTGTPPSGFLNW